MHFCALFNVPCFFIDFWLFRREFAGISLVLGKVAAELWCGNRYRYSIIISCSSCSWICQPDLGSTVLLFGDSPYFAALLGKVHFTKINFCITPCITEYRALQGDGSEIRKSGYIYIYFLINIRIYIYCKQKIYIYIWMGKSWDKLPTSMLAGFPSIVPLGKHQPNNSVACQECAWCGFWSLRLRQPNLNSGSWFLLYRSGFFDFLYVFSKKRVGFWK